MKRPPVEHQFKPGQSGNPSGRPKGSISLVRILKRLLFEEIQVKGKTIDEKKTRAELLIKQVINLALKRGDKDMIKLIFSYLEGLPKQQIDVRAEVEEMTREELAFRIVEILEEANLELRPTETGIRIASKSLTGADNGIIGSNAENKEKRRK